MIEPTGPTFWQNLPRYALSGPIIVVQWVRKRRDARRDDSSGLEPLSPVAPTAVLRYGPFEIDVATEVADDGRELARLLRPSVRSIGADDDRADRMVLTVRRQARAGQLLIADLDGAHVAGDALPNVARSLLADLDLRLLVAERGWTHLHAGAVSISGRGVLIPAVSGAGKSNLTAALTRGHALLTDELVAVDRRAGLLRAAMRPICFKPASHDRGAALAPGEPRPAADRPWLLPAAALGGTNQSVAVPWLIVVPQRRPGSPDVVSITPTEALEQLVGQSFDVTVDPRQSLLDLAWLVSAVPAVRVRYEEACDAVPVIVDVVSRTHERGDVAAWEEVSGIDGARPHPRRAPGVLGVVVGDGALIWRPDTKVVLRLDGAAAAVWEHLDGNVEVPDPVVPFVEELVAHDMVDLGQRPPA